MKKIRNMSIVVCMLAVLFFVNASNADLSLLGQGTSVHGTYNLIYDTDYDITWYDFSYSLSGWDNSVAWADAMSVTFGSNTYSDWRLPTALNQDGGGPCNASGGGHGYNCIENELGHLYYTELQNKGYYDTETQSYPQPGWGLNNTGDFQNLIKGEYWTGTELGDPILAMWYDMKYGYQYPGNKNAPDFYSIAVMDGRAIIPEDIDDDGFDTTVDCDDAASSCTTDCTTDSDSDGVVDCLDLCTDVDLDDYGTDESTTIIGDGIIPIGSCTTDSVTPCTFGDGICLDSDCDDTDPAINPDATEVCDSVDNNCINGIDEGFNVGNICYSLPNSCGDYNTGSFICTVDGSGTECNVVQPDERSGYGDSCVSAPNNCGDTNSGVYVCADVGVECNAVTPNDRALATAFIDSDNDGYGDINSPVDATCGMPSGAVDNSLDCDDTNASINPNAIEVCNSEDDNCNGTIDEGFDVDGDGYTICEGDCDDSDANNYPSNTEVCDGQDNNCNGQVDEIDGDGDNVSDCIDNCPDTTLPEDVPTKRLKVRHYADVDGDGIFETKKRPFKPITDSTYTMADTYGCSCKQILDLKPGKNRGEKFFGCTKGTMKMFINKKGWAKRLFK